MSFSTPLQKQPNTSFYTPQDDTFVHARRRPLNSSDDRVKTTNTIEIGDNKIDMSELFDSNNPVKPTSGITPYTPIKSLVSSPFKTTTQQQQQQQQQRQQLQRPNLAASTPLDPSMSVRSPGFQASPSMLQRKVQAREQLNYSSTPKEDGEGEGEAGNKTLFSEIYERSIFKPRRGPESSRPGSPMASPQRTYRAINESLYVENREARDRSQMKKPAVAATSAASDAATAAAPAAAAAAGADESLDSPYVQMARRRIINRDHAGRQFLLSTLFALAYRLVVAVGRLILVKIEMSQPDFGQKYAASLKYLGYANYVIYAVTAVRIITSIVQLVEPQDMCLDLPLTDKQRKVLGLPIQQGADEDDDSPQTTATQGAATPGAAVSGASNGAAGGGNTTVLKMPSVLLESLDISKSFANMNLSTPQTAQAAATGAAAATAAAAGDETSPDKIKERLLSCRKQRMQRNYTPRQDALDASFKKPSSKFIYDLTNDDSLY